MSFFTKDERNSLFRDLRAIKKQLKCLIASAEDQPQIEGLSPIPYCLDGAVTGFVAYILDEETNTPTPLYFDASGAPTGTVPEGEPCATKPDYEYKTRGPICRKDEDTGEEYQVEYCDIFIDGTLNSTVEFWYYPDGSVSNTAPAVTLVSCTDEGKFVSSRKLCLTNDSTGAGVTTGGTRQEFLDSFSGTTTTEDFSSVPDGSYSSIIVPTGTYTHYDWVPGNPGAGTQRTIVKQTPISQNGASLPIGGIETVGGGTTSQNAIKFEPTSPIGVWGADILDIESNPAFAEAQIIAYDSANNIIDQTTLPNGEDIVQFVGFIDVNNSIACIEIVVGDANGGLLQDQLALANVVTGQFEEFTALSEYTEVVCFVNGQLVTTVLDADGNEVTDQAILDSLDDCEVDPIEILDYEYIRTPICDTDTNTTLLQQSLYINDVLQTPVMYFDILGEMVGAPANFTYGACEPLMIDFEESPICIDNTTNGVIRTYTDTATQIEIAVEFYDAMGQVIPIPVAWEYGSCEGCQDVGSQGTILDWNVLRN